MTHKVLIFPPREATPIGQPRNNEAPVARKERSAFRGPSPNTTDGDAADSAALHPPYGDGITCHANTPHHPPHHTAFLTPDYTDTPYYALPFIYPHARGGHWSPPPCAEYLSACARGRGYAAHLAQFLKANPLLAGGNTLGNIARVIDYADPARHGLWVGLFSYLELLVLDGVMSRPVFDDWHAYESGHARPWV